MCCCTALPLPAAACVAVLGLSGLSQRGQGRARAERERRTMYLHRMRWQPPGVGWRAAHDVYTSRDRDAPAVADAVAARRSTAPSQPRLGRASATECGWHSTSLARLRRISVSWAARRRPHQKQGRSAGGSKWRATCSHHSSAARWRMQLLLPHGTALSQWVLGRARAEHERHATSSPRAIV